MYPLWMYKLGKVIFTDGTDKITISLGFYYIRPLCILIPFSIGLLLQYRYPRSKDYFMLDVVTISKYFFFFYFIITLFCIDVFKFEPPETTNTIKVRRKEEKKEKFFKTNLVQISFTVFGRWTSFVTAWIFDGMDVIINIQAEIRRLRSCCMRNDHSKHKYSHFNLENSISGGKKLMFYTVFYAVPFFTSFPMFIHLIISKICKICKKCYFKRDES